MYVLIILLLLLKACTYSVCFLLILVAADLQEYVLIFIVPMIEIFTKKICTIIYICKTPTYNIGPKT